MLVGVESPDTVVIREREDVGGRDVRPETVLKVGGLVRRDGDTAVLTVRRERTSLPAWPLLARTGETDRLVARADCEEMPDPRTVWDCCHVVTEMSNINITQLLPPPVNLT